MKDSPLGIVIFGSAIAILPLIFLTLMLLQFFFLPKGVKIDYQNKNITVKFLIAKPLILLPSDIVEFCSIKTITKSTVYEGILIRTKKQKEFILSNFNLANYEPIKIFLEDSKVIFSGHNKFSFFAYFFRYFSH